MEEALNKGKIQYVFLEYLLKGHRDKDMVKNLFYVIVNGEQSVVEKRLVFSNVKLVYRYQKAKNVLLNMSR
jgi:hypothetical protein